MPVNKFKPACDKGADLPEIEYSALWFTVGDRNYRLALHLDQHPLRVPDAKRSWIVSDPESGYKVCVVKSSLHGVPCSSAGIGKQLARQLAIADLGILVSRIGSARFNEIINLGRARRGVANASA